MQKSSCACAWLVACAMLQRACAASAGSAGASTGAAAAKTYASSFVIAGATDVVASGGAMLTANPVYSIRSGSPGQKSLVRMVAALTPGVTVESMSFAYRHTRGYGSDKCKGSTFAVRAAGVDMFTSPHLPNYPYSKSKPNYSPPVTVAKKGLSVPVPKDGASYFELSFDNGDSNVELMLPLRFNMTCSGGPCTSLPLLPQFFDDNMVLQRDTAATLYGTTGVPGELVSVELVARSTGHTGARAEARTNTTQLIQQEGKATKTTFTAKVAANGSWVVHMDAQKASSGWTVTVTSGKPPAARTRVLKNVAFGDVYLCSGQSNMGVRVTDAFNATAEVADSANYPDLRMWTAALVIAESPQTDIPSMQSKMPASDALGPFANSSWGAAAPAAFPGIGVPGNAMPNGGYGYFSATCYFFGRDVYKHLGGKVPVGLMASDWGGQPIEPFMSPDALDDKTCGGTRNATATATAIATTTAAAVRVEAEGHTQGGHHQQDYTSYQEAPLRWPHVNVNGTAGDGAREGSGASVLWWGMTQPLSQMRMTGAVWYQGETNFANPGGYACSFPAMISDWRRKFQLPDMSFFFVQLAPSTQLGDFVKLRNAQMVALQLPNVGYAVAIDIGDISSPMGSIHPRRKQEVGRRLALEAQRIQYGDTKVVSTGPVLASVTAGPKGDTLVVSYAAGTAGGLHAAPTADCGNTGSKACCNESPFEVLTPNKQNWLRAKYTLNGEKATLETPDGFADPPQVRYAWEQWPQCSLYNGKGGCDDHTGIAATPFCYDGKGPCAV